MNIQNDLYVLLPELILAVGAMALLLIGAVRGDRSANTLTILAVLLIGASAYLSMVIGDGSAFDGAFVMDSFARFTKAVILWSSAACVLLAHRFFSDEKSERFELPVLIVLASLGMSLMVSANNFIALYMGLELQSLALYVLAAFNREFRAIVRGWPEILRPRLAVVRHDALRHLDDLRLHRHDGFPRRRACHQG